jgi:chromosome segregation ATPase
LQYKTHDKHPGKAFHWHTKKHSRLMNRVLDAVKNHQPAWNAALDAHYANKALANEQRFKNTQARNAYKESAQGKLDALREAEKRWKSKKKRAETRLKNIQRKIKMWEKKASGVKEKTSGIALSATTKLLRSHSGGASLLSDP